MLSDCNCDLPSKQPSDKDVISNDNFTLDPRELGFAVDFTRWVLVYSILCAIRFVTSIAAFKTIHYGLETHRYGMLPYANILLFLSGLATLWSIMGFICLIGDNSYQCISTCPIVVKVMGCLLFEGILMVCCIVDAYVPKKQTKID